MSSMEYNKIFAALLVAGIITSLSGFTSEKIFGSHEAESASTHKIAISSTEHATRPAAPTMAEPVLALIASADIVRGKKLSRACAACHSFDKNGRNGIGPNLWDIINRAKAGGAGFLYSDAMEQTGGNWNYADMNKFLWKPKKYIEGTKMNFVGIKKTADRAAMIGWLRTLSDDMAGLPSAGDIIAETPHAEEAHTEESQTDGHHAGGHH